MQLDESKSHSNVQVILEDRPATVDLRPGDCPGTFSVVLGGEELTDAAEYDGRFDAYSHMSDDGHEYYLRMRILGVGSVPTPVLPDPIRLKTEALAAIQVVTASVVAGETDGMDLVFAAKTLSSAAMIHEAFERTGSIAGAHKALLAEIFGL